MPVSWFSFLRGAAVGANLMAFMGPHGDAINLALAGVFLIAEIARVRSGKR